MTTLNPILLGIWTVLCIYTVIFGYKKTAASKNVAAECVPAVYIQKPIYMTAFVIILLVASAVRMYRFGAVPAGILGDEAMSAINAKALADWGVDIYGTSYPVHLNAWGYGQQSALLAYMMIPFIKLFGLNSIAIRIPLLITSMLGLIVLYFFCRSVFGSRTALVVFACAAISPWHIMQSRWALDCNLYPHFFLFGVLFLNWSLKHRFRKLLLSVSMLMFGLCMYCYGISIYTLPLFLILTCVYLLLKKKVRISEALLALAVWLAVSWPFITVMAINFFGWDTLEIGPFTLQYFADSVRSNDILFFSDNIGTQFIYNLKSILSIVFLQSDPLPWNNIEIYGSIYKFSMPLVLLGLGWTISQLRKNTGAVLIFFMWLTGLWCGICTNGINTNRINIIFYPQLILWGLGAAILLKNLKKLPFKATFAGVYLVVFILFSRCYFDPYNEHTLLMDRHSSTDFIQALESIKNSDAEKIYITESPIGTDVSFALTLFYHQLDAPYYLGEMKIDGLLPFAQRYTFSYIKNLKIDENEDAVYLVTGDDLKYFTSDLYDIEQFGQYYFVLDRKQE